MPRDDEKIVMASKGVAMTPLELRILLHYYYSPEPFDELSDAQVGAEKNFVSEGLLKEVDNVLKITPMGKFYIDYILRTPLPIMTFCVPRHPLAGM